jgi:hypothetical protein
MKKIVRLTESDLVRLVKKVIKEQEFDMDMGIDCDRILDDMEYVYNDTMRYYNRYNKSLSPDRQNFKLEAEEIYDDLASELSGFVDEAYQNDCENYGEVESMYYELLDMFVEETRMGNMTESIKRAIQEDSGFTFGDKIKNKLKNITGYDTITDDESRLADDIMSAVENGDYKILDRIIRPEGFNKHIDGYKISVSLNDGDYIVTPMNTFRFDYVTSVKTPSGEVFRFEQSGFAKKLIKLIKSSDTDYGFKYPK